MKLSVITGGAGGMGLGCAKILGKRRKLLLVDVSQEKLDEAVAVLADEGITDVETAICDISDRAAVKALAEHAASIGEVTDLLNIAGVSSACPPEVVLKVNLLGVYNVIEEFFQVMGEGSNMVTVNSLSTHLQAPAFQGDTLAMIDDVENPDYLANVLAFVKGFAAKVNGPEGGIAYGTAKFFSWRYSRRNVKRLYTKGIRINTVTPGVISTPMGVLEKDGCERMMAGMAIQRYGTPEEMCNAICWLTEDLAADITGIDLPVDGGYTCIMQFPQIEA